jgi:hypothetical protein
VTDLHERGFDALMAQLVEAAPGRVAELVVPRLTVLGVSGHGSPGDDEFRTAVRDLYALAFAVRMLPRTSGAPAGHHEYDMPPMHAVFNSLGRTGAWRIGFPAPAFVTAAVVASARANLGERAGPSDVTLGHLDEGLCVQTLHVGPFNTQGRTVQVLRAFAASRGHQLVERRHEIYLDDPQKVSPEAMRTVIRYPVRTAR